MLSILLLNITIPADTVWRKRKRKNNGTDLFEQYFKEGKLYMTEDQKVMM